MELLGLLLFFAFVFWLFTSDSAGEYPKDSGYILATEGDQIFTASEQVKYDLHNDEVAFVSSPDNWPTHLRSIREGGNIYQQAEAAHQARQWYLKHRTDPAVRRNVRRYAESLPAQQYRRRTGGNWE